MYIYIYFFFFTESYSHTSSYTQTCFDPKIFVSTSTISPSIHFLHRLSLTSGIGLWTKSSRLVIAHETTPQLSENETHETHRLAIDSWDNWTKRLNILRVSHSFFWQTWWTFFCYYLDWNYWCLAELQAKIGWVCLFCFATFVWWGGVASLRKLVSCSNCRASQAEFCCKRTCIRSQNGRPHLKIR